MKNHRKMTFGMCGVGKQAAQGYGYKQKNNPKLAGLNL